MIGLPNISQGLGQYLVISVDKLYIDVYIMIIYIYCIYDDASPKKLEVRRNRTEYIDHTVIIDDALSIFSGGLLYILVPVKP